MRKEILRDAELERLEVQARLDRSKTHSERNRLGQFATPSALASEALEYARTLLAPDTRIRFLDPAFGTGSFYSALLRAIGSNRVASARGYEVDPLYGREATQVWAATPLRLEVADFTRALAPEDEAERANLLICNPPYVRHHHLCKDEKQRLRLAAAKASGVMLSGLAGLYCHFLLLSHAWMTESGLAGWLVPSEFMDVGYGKALKDYLLDRVTLLRIHRFDPKERQFEDALVSSAVVWFENVLPPASHHVEFTYGGTLSRPAISAPIPVATLRRAPKWTRFPLAPEAGAVTQNARRFKDLFDIKRGIATGANGFFILTREQADEHRLPDRFLVPILPSPRYLADDEINGDDEGFPLLDRERFLLSCSLPEAEVRSSYPSLWRYLRKGVEDGISERYLCRHRRPWYSQETRLPAPLLCTYMNRRGSADGKLFRFVLNRSKATAPNVYLMLYPKPVLRKMLDSQPELLKRVWSVLNMLDPETLLGEGRVYGGGLYKLEPKELGNASARAIAAAIPELAAEPPGGAENLMLFAESGDSLS